MTSRSNKPLHPDTVVAVAEIAARIASPFVARKELHELANKRQESQYAVRAAYRIERRKIEENKS